MASLTSTLNLGNGSADKVCSVIGGTLMGVGTMRTYSSSSSGQFVNCSVSGNTVTINCSTDNYFRAPFEYKYTYTVPSSGVYALVVGPASKDSTIVTNFSSCSSVAVSSGSPIYQVTHEGLRQYVLSGGTSFNTGGTGSSTPLSGAICRLS